MRLCSFRARIFGLMIVRRRAATVVQAISALAILLTGCSQPTSDLDWNPVTAAQYLDHRAEVWMHSRLASRDQGTACLSCHTTVAYALARGELGRLINERSLPDAQRELLSMVDKRVALWPTVLPWYRNQKLASRGTEAVLNALVLANTDASRGHLSSVARAALDDLWPLQQIEGPEAGSWPWIDFHNEPWEAGDSVYYGATLAALAIGLAPDGYIEEPAIRGRCGLLKEYLQRHYVDQPLLNRIDLLWAAEAWPDLMDSQMRAALLRELSAQQRPDGGWSIVTLMPSWKRIDGSSLSAASDGYATGFVSWVMEKAGVSTHDLRLRRSLTWLKSHQSRWNGHWPADSLNRRYRFWQETRHFMDDAATAFAVLALTHERSDILAREPMRLSGGTPDVRISSGEQADTGGVSLISGDLRYGPAFATR